MSRRASPHGGFLFHAERSPLFEIARVLMPLDHVAGIRDNGQRVDLRYTTVSKFDIATPTQTGVS